MATVFLHDIGVVSDEFESAKRLKTILENGLCDVDGMIWLIPSVYIHPGTGYHDLDLLMIGYLEDFYHDILDCQDVEIKSFCTTIEIKSHGIDGVYRDGQNLMVKYDKGPSNVTRQSEGQKESLKKFLSESLQMNKRIPFITNIIWLTGVNYDDFENTVALTCSNIITEDVTIEDIFVAIGRQITLRNYGFIDAFRDYSKKEVESVANIFCAKSSGVDTMTLRRMNILQQNNAFLKNIVNDKNPIIVVSGHAGTGKTMILLQTADYLARREYKCLFLTYNTALISDLKHTMEYMPSNMMDIKMESMHSFIISVLYSNGLWSNSHLIEKDFATSVNTLYRIKDNIRYNHEYEYVFVDEAQDWEKPIPEILKYIFKNSHIVIADGVDQFMRSSEHTNWGDPIIPKLKKCQRQRRNVTVFAKLFANKMGVYWDVEPNCDFPGGKVLIYNEYNSKIHEELLSDAKNHGCVEYDMMLLTPRSLTTSGKFDLIDTYRKNNIRLYDGVDKQKRNQIYGKENAQNKEVRIYSYESCRGLEAWTTVCLRFNELFTKEHPHDYREIEYSMARNYMLTLWTLIPLTRAIDTLVLIVDKDSYVSVVLKELSKENPDFIIYR